MKIFCIIFLLFFPIAQTTVAPVIFSQESQSWVGIASYYHQKFEGRKTANGEVFSNSAYTAAHKFLPLGTYVKVTHLKNGREVTVKINDRLPQNSKRMIDLARIAASDLNMIKAGLAKVRIEVVEEEEPVIEEAEE